MSDFEKEYLNYAKDSAPDLWDRIEAGVDAYEASAAQEDKKNIDNKDADNEKVVFIESAKEKAENTKQKSLGKRSIRKYSGLIAAAAALVIIVPAISVVSKNSSGMHAQSAAPAATADVAEAATACEPEEVYEPEEAYEADEVADVAHAMSESSELDMEDTAPAEKTMAQKSGTGDEAMIVEASWERSASVTDCPVVQIDDNENSRIRIHFSEDVTDFELLKISITDVSDDGKITYDGYDLFKSDVIYAGEDIVFQVTFPGDSPNHAISFTDSSGETKVYAMFESGKDGSVILSEI